MKKIETDAVRAIATAVFTFVNDGNDVAMRDHDSLEIRSVSVKSTRWVSPTFRESGCPTREHKVG
jgi:hypothetical protein